MLEQQTTIPVQIHELTEKVAEYKKNGFRLVQIGCTKLDGDALEINYSFDKGYRFINLRLSLASADEEVPSVSGAYWGAFLYENEISDLFGVKIKDKAIDYQGKFYRTAVKWPFNPPKQQKASDEGAA